MTENQNLTRRQQRFRLIDYLLRNKRFPTLASMVEELEEAGLSASSRTVKRDIEYMRDLLGAPIEARRTRLEDYSGRMVHYYTLADRSWTLGDIPIFKDDLLAIQLARQLLAQYRGLPVPDRLLDIYKRLLTLADQDVTLTAEAESLAPISFSPLSDDRIDPQVWDACLTGIQQRRMLNMVYKRGYGNPRPERRRIEPYHILNLQGTWYLIGTAGLNDDDLRQYRMSRIQEARVTRAPFTIPDNFHPHDLLHRAFGRFIGRAEDEVEIVVRFSPRARQLIEAGEFCPDGKRKVLKGGRLELRFHATKSGPWPYWHVLRWVWSWGREINVVSPEELVLLVREGG